MIKDGVFSINGVSVANIASLSSRQALIAEQKICEISEIANEALLCVSQMLSEGYGIYEVLTVIAEGFSDNTSFYHTSILPENVSRVATYLKMGDTLDKVLFSQMLIEKAKDAGLIIAEGDFLPADFGNENFTYVKNPLADEAYDVFSQDFNDPRVKYSGTLTEAASAVSRGEVEYALLPLEERGGVRLAAVAALLFKEDLKINSVIPVFGYEGIADMKYALVSKHFSLPDFCDDDDRYLEIRLRVDSSVPLSELFFASEALGSDVYRVNTISFDTEDGAIPYYSVVFREVGRDFCSLLVYLTLFSGAYTPVGVYKNLE